MFYHPESPNLTKLTLTPLIGREQEVAAVCRLLQRPEVRLVTLTGTGDVGKTRLGLEVASTLQDDFADGACFVPLAPVSDPARVLTPAQALASHQVIPPQPPQTPQQVQASPTAPTRPASSPAGRTTREMEVLRLVAQGLTDAQVAEQLIVSPRTVNWHLTSIYSKIGVSSRSAATRFVIEHKLV